LKEKFNKEKKEKKNLAKKCKKLEKVICSNEVKKFS
jgi:hypothetical protein